MASTVLRPNHYELLGLTPEASADEIVQAFAKELGLLRPRAFGTLAEVTVAFETLKDPIKRSAYDASIGLKPEPARPSPQALPEWAPFLVRASTGPVEKPAIPLPSPPPQVSASLPPEPRFEPRMAPSATALLHAPIKPAVRETPSTFSEKREEPRQPEKIERPLDRSELEYVQDARDFASNWKLPAIAAGALILAVGVGAWSGWEAGNDNESVTVKVPSAKPPPVTGESAPTPAASIIEEVPPVEPAQSAVPKAPTARERPPLQIDLPDEQQAEAAQPGQSEPVGSEPAIAESTATAGTMPLSNAVIASTIRRIGYPCTQISSTSAVEGAAPGVFTVTCASGESYRAAPVRGRYHFRRLSGR